MKYRCELCSKTFETEGSKTAERCPACLRKNGLTLIGGKKAKPASDTKGRPAWVLPAAAVGLTALLLAAYLTLKPSGPQHDPEGPVPLSPLTIADLQAFAEQQSVRLRGLEQALEPNDAIEALGDSLGGSDGAALADDLMSKIREHREARAFVPWSRSAPRDTAPRNASDTAPHLVDDGEAAHLYPLEVALTAASTLRSRDVPAMVTEVYRYPGDGRPPDPNGHLGYFGIAIPEGDGWSHFDPYEGRDAEPEADDVRVLTDLQAIAALVNHRAEFNLVHEGNERRALEQSAEAARLDPRSPCIRTVRGAILLSSGAGRDGIEEMETAAQLRRDATRRNNLAGLYLAQGDSDRAQREVGLALEEFPEFAAGHATLAALALQRGEFSEAEQALRTAERLDPGLVNLAMLWANYHLLRGNVDEAIEHAERAVEQRPHEIQSRLTLGRILRQAGRYDEMRRQAREVIDLTPSSRRSEMQALIHQLLGPTALEEPMDEELAEDSEWDAPAADPLADLQLEEPSGALGGQEDDGPSLLGDDELMGGAPLPNSDDPSTLRLRDPTEGLRLQF